MGHKMLLLTNKDTLPCFHGKSSPGNGQLHRTGYSMRLHHADGDLPSRGARKAGPQILCFTLQGKTIHLLSVHPSLGDTAHSPSFIPSISLEKLNAGHRSCGCCSDWVQAGRWPAGWPAEAAGRTYLIRPHAGNSPRLLLPQNPDLIIVYWLVCEAQLSVTQVSSTSKRRGSRR